ncbi:response regulator transcription factor [Pontibacterium sp. N1Y112]|uniref:Response regulator transcription factor n=1 Tax=Pontibacterium sinense TaxID=2781979 RepID=A0A8J7FN48_9GAMM|nr:response regulator transcription factor [Pontibacterium sinense]MBE9399373.1 response regulator transcription factor [Pontibacterium sinense]
MEKPHKILIADRYPLHREGIKLAITSGPEYVLYAAHCVSSIDELQSQVKNNSGYHLLIIDQTLIEQHSEWSLKHLVSNTCITTLLMCDQLTDSLINEARHAGIRGVVERSASMERINKVTHRLLKGGSYWPVIDKNSRTTPVAPDHCVSLDDFTEQQLQIIRLIIDGKLNKQISYQLGIHESTVKYHLTNIYRKFQVRSRTQLVVSARHSGVTDQIRL